MASTNDLTKSQKLLYALIQRLGTADDKVKLAKLQYFSDFIHFAFNDRPISDPSTLYERRAFGPLSATFNLDLNRLLDLGLVKKPGPYTFVPTEEKIDVDLDANELKTVDYVIDKYAKYPYDTLVDISHKQMPYIASNEGGIVDYTTAYNLVEEYTDYSV